MAASARRGTARRKKPAGRQEQHAGQFAVSLDTGRLEFELIYSRRRTVTIIVRPDARVVVRAPHHYPHDAIADLLQRRADWIKGHQRRLSLHAPPSLTFQTGDQLYWLGQPLTLEVRVAARRSSVRCTDGRLLIAVTDPADRAAVEQAIQRWAKREATRAFEERLEACWPLVAGWGVPRPVLRVRFMRSRWGSCTSRGAITLSVRLAQADVSLIDHVILHELCHLRELNHGPAFYALLASIEPDHAARRKALRQVKASL